MNKLKITVFALLLLQTQADLFAMRLLKKASLHELCATGKLEEVKKITPKAGLGINNKNKKGDTPLHIAIKNKRLAIVEHLLEHSHIDLRKTDRSGDTAFDAACKIKQLMIAQLVFRNMNETQESIFRNACKRRKPATAKHLVEHFDYNITQQYKSGDYPIDIACRYSQAIAQYLATKLYYRMLDIMVKACQYGKLPTIQFYFEKFKPNTNTSKTLLQARKSPQLLLTACKFGQVTIVKYLLKKGAKLKVCNNEGYTPLHFACHNGNLELVKLLVKQHKTDIHAQSKNKLKPIDLAKKQNHTNSIEYLEDIEKKEISKLSEACGNGDLKKVKYYIENLGYSVESRNKRSRTLLLQACAYGKLEIAQYLILEKEANLEAFSRNGVSPIGFASSQEYKDIVELILSKRIDLLDKLDKRGCNPLHWACFGGHLDMVKLLVEQHKANIHALTKKKKMPIDLAKKKNHTKVVKYLQNREKLNLLRTCKNRDLKTVKYYIKELRYSVETRDADKNTLLHIACATDQPAIVQYLLEKGANVEAYNAIGNTPLCLACTGECKDIAIQILNKKENLANKKDKRNFTPLHYACWAGKLEIVALLVEKYNAHINIRSQSGKRPIDLAKDENHTAVVEYLQQIEKKQISHLCNACKRGNRQQVQYYIEELEYSVNTSDNILNSLLHIACAAGETTIVQYLLEKDATLETYNMIGSTPLCLAAASGYKYPIMLILKKREDLVNKKDMRNCTPLHYASWAGKLETVKLLVEKHNADIHVRSQSGKRPIDLAKDENHTSIVVYLQNREQKEISNAFSACKNGDLKKVKYYIEELEYSVKTRNADKNTLLHIACTVGQPAIVQYLLDKGANIESFNTIGSTPLGLACTGECKDVVIQILNKRKDLANKKDKRNFTPLHYACWAGKLEIVKLLVKDYNAHINMHSQSGKRPIDLAKKENHTNIVKYLQQVEKMQISHLCNTCRKGHLSTVKHYIDELKYSVNTSDNELNTLLHIACAADQPEIVRYLLDKDASLETYNVIGSTTLGLACTGKYKDIVRQILNKRKDLINKMDMRNFAPLHYACWAGKLGIVKLLVETYDADINTRSKLGTKPIDLAKSKNHTSVVNYLQNREFQAKQKILELFEDVKYSFKNKNHKKSLDTCTHCSKLFKQDELIAKAPSAQAFHLGCLEQYKKEIKNCDIIRFKKTNETKKIII